MGVTEAVEVVVEVVEEVAEVAEVVWMWKMGRRKTRNGQQWIS